MLSKNPSNCNTNPVNNVKQSIPRLGKCYLNHVRMSLRNVGVGDGRELEMGKTVGPYTHSYWI